MSARRRLWAVTYAMLLAACSVEPRDDQPGPAPAKKPGEPFGDNVCFACSLRHCALATRACLTELQCARWIECVSACPTDATGVAAEGACVRRCGLPVSAEVLFQCVQDFSTGLLLGCESACTPL